MGSGATRIRTGAHMGSRACKARTLTTCAIVLGPVVLFFDRNDSLAVIWLCSENMSQVKFYVMIYVHVSACAYVYASLSFCDSPMVNVYSSVQMLVCCLKFHKEKLFGETVDLCK